MKFSVLIPSRSNPAGLVTVIGVLRELSSDKHEIDFHVSLDSDDKLLENYKRLLHNFNIILSINDRAPSLGYLHNRLAEKVQGTDCFLPMSDRMICLTPHWDEELAKVLEERDNCVFWWSNPYGLVFPVVPVKWYNAAGRIFNEYFSFWFDDTWISEVNAMVHGLPHLILPIKCHMKRATRTKRLRDLRFWMDFFIMKRPERREEAKKIAHTLDIVFNPDTPILAHDEFWETNWQKIEDDFKDLNPPDEIYLKAKARAEAIMKEIAS